MIPEKTIKDLLKKHTTLEKDLSTGDIDKKNFAEKSKEYSDLNEIIKDAKNYISYEKNKFELEKILSDMVSENALYCKIDRPMGIVSFVKNQSPEAVLDRWSNDVSKMLTLIDQTCHLIAKENMVNQASGGK